MAWWLFGKESKAERELRELREMLSGQGGPKASKEIDIDPFVDGGEETVSPLEDIEAGFVQLRGVWDGERQGFKIEMDWNAPYLQNALAMGIEGESKFEVAALGVLALATQVIETEQDRRATESNQVQE